MYLLPLHTQRVSQRWPLAFARVDPCLGLSPPLVQPLERAGSWARFRVADPQPAAAPGEDAAGPGQAAGAAAALQQDAAARNIEFKLLYLLLKYFLKSSPRIY